MAAGTQDVKDILDTDLTNTEITNYLSQAGSMVTNDRVQSWLTAHLITVSRERKADKESVGDHSVTFAGETGLGLNSTRYGQTAQFFDTDDELPSGGETATFDISSW